MSLLSTTHSCKTEAVLSGGYRRGSVTRDDEGGSRLWQALVKVPRLLEGDHRPCVRGCSVRPTAVWGEPLPGSLARLRP